MSRLLDPPVLRGKSSISWSEFSESLIQASMVPSGLVLVVVVVVCLRWWWLFATPLLGIMFIFHPSVLPLLVAKLAMPTVLAEVSFELLTWWQVIGWGVLEDGVGVRLYLRAAAGNARRLKGLVLIVKLERAYYPATLTPGPHST